MEGPRIGVQQFDAAAQATNELEAEKECWGNIVDVQFYWLDNKDFEEYQY